jgi:hypothetical protein
MLRITRMDCEDGTVRLKLEGRLVGEWVGLLERTCGDLHRGLQRALVLDLEGVSFARQEGLDLLRRLEADGINCAAQSHFLKELSRGASP